MLRYIIRFDALFSFDFNPRTILGVCILVIPFQHNIYLPKFSGNLE
jgi:hypothetical protein